MRTKAFVSLISMILFMGILVDGCRNNPEEDNWIHLFGEHPDKYWEVFIGAPHSSVTDLDCISPSSDGTNAEPLGLNHDPKNVFSFIKSEDGTLLHISGEIYGALTSKKEYGNYHLQLQYKWGDRKWEPRLGKPRDSGILYHCTGRQGAFWNAWMQSQEFQVQEGDCGDYYSLLNTYMDIPSELGADGIEYDYKEGAELRNFSLIHSYPNNHCNKAFDNEKPQGEWNTLDLVCVGDTSLHIVNGKVVMALYNPKIQKGSGQIVPLRKGLIQIQSEGAEVFYKNIKIRCIDVIPEIFKVSN